MYSFPGAGITNCHKSRGLKQKKFMLWKFWRLEVQNQAVNRLVLCRSSWWGRISGTPLSGLLVAACNQRSLAFSCIPPISAFTMPSSLCIHSSTFLLRIPVILNLGWCHLEILSLIISVGTLFPNQITVTGSGGKDLDVFGGVGQRLVLFNPQHLINNDTCDF